jgi:phosphoglycerate dehydrogenase-like enzyme
MPKILVEEDHFLKILSVILDPHTPQAHKNAIARFFAHDVPDFEGWCERLRARIPGLFPSEIIYVDGQADLAAAISDADAVIVESLRIDAPMLAHARRLALVQKFGVLTRNIDLAACSAANIPVQTLRRVGNIAVAEHAFSLMATLAKQICEYNHVVTRPALEARGLTIRDRSPYIGYSNPAGIPGLKTLHGATLGIIGFGEVGREIARFAAAFEMKTIYFQRTRLAATEEAALGVAYAPLRDLLAQSHYAIVQLPLNQTTRDILGRDELGCARPGMILVNVARAELVNHQALVEALDSGRIGGFALDVGYSEPTATDEPLLRFKSGNVILTPHTAIGARQNALLDMETMCLNLWKHICKRPL